MVSPLPVHSSLPAQLSACLARGGGCQSPVILESVSPPVTLELNFFPKPSRLVQVVQPAGSFYLTMTSSSQGLTIELSAWKNIALLNKRGKPYQVYCLDDKLSIPESKPSCLYQNKWHGLLVSQKGTSAVGPILPEVHKYDINTPTTTLNEALKEEAPPPLMGNHP